ncbi:MAG: DUF3821 domain-containing protein [Methanoregula sp.]
MRRRQSVEWMKCIFFLAAALFFIIPVAGAAGGIIYVHQGQTVRVNDTLDITGVASPYTQLAYWDGVDMYNSVPSYIVGFTSQREENFYLDPKIFSTRLGAWYKYDKKTGYEPHGNNLAFFVVARDSFTELTNTPAPTPTPGITLSGFSLPAFPSPVPSPAPTSTPQPVIPSLPAQVDPGMSMYAMGISIILVGLFFALQRLLR